MHRSWRLVGWHSKTGGAHAEEAPEAVDLRTGPAWLQRRDTGLRPGRGSAPWLPEVRPRRTRSTVVLHSSSGRHVPSDASAGRTRAGRASGSGGGPLSCRLPGTSPRVRHRRPPAGPPAPTRLPPPSSSTRDPLPRRQGVPCLMSPQAVSQSSPPPPPPPRKRPSSRPPRPPHSAHPFC